MPNGPNEPLINGKMWKHIIIQSLYQVFVQLICLFVLPLMVDRYKPRDEQQYIRDNCLATTSQHLGIPIGTGAYNNGTAPDATWYCNVMTYCGFPLNRAFANTNLCPVYRSPDPTPDAAVDAICFNTGNATGTSCAVYTRFDSALSQLYSQINDANDAAQIRSLSLLFNAFIWCQVRAWWRAWGREVRIGAGMCVCKGAEAVSTAARRCLGDGAKVGRAG